MAKETTKPLLNLTVRIPRLSFGWFGFKKYQLNFQNTDTKNHFIIRGQACQSVCALIMHQKISYDKFGSVNASFC